MGGEIGLAGLIERIGELFAAQCLQAVTVGGFPVAVIDNQGEAGIATHPGADPAGDVARKRAVLEYRAVIGVAQEGRNLRCGNGEAVDYNMGLVRTETSNDATAKPAPMPQPPRAFMNGRAGVGLHDVNANAVPAPAR